MLKGLLLRGLLLEGLVLKGQLLERLLVLEGDSRVTKTSPDWSKQLPNRKVNFSI